MTNFVVKNQRTGYVLARGNSYEEVCDDFRAKVRYVLETGTCDKMWEMVDEVIDGIVLEVENDS